MAVTSRDQYIHKVNGEIQYVTEKLILDANGSVTLGNNLIGGYLFSCEILTSADDAVTVSIASGIGADFFSHTTTAATSGEFATISDRYTINSAPTLTVANMSSGTVTVEVVTAKK